MIHGAQITPCSAYHVATCAQATLGTRAALSRQRQLVVAPCSWESVTKYSCARETNQFMGVA